MVDENTTPEVLRVLEQDVQGNLGRLFALQRDRLTTIVSFRLDDQLRGCNDIDSILDEVYSEAAQQIEHYISNPSTTFFVWLRQATLRVLTRVHQRNSEIVKSVCVGPETTVYSVAALRAEHASFADFALQSNQHDRLLDAMDQLNDWDREILVMRHMEKLTNQEVAEVLQVANGVASEQYLQALRALRGRLGDSYVIVS